MYYVLHVQGVSKKAPPQKNFWNIFTSVKPFCVKFCNFVGNSYPHISANFWSFILIFHQMALICPRVPIVFTPLPGFYAELLSHVVDSTADFLNSAQLPPFVRVTGNDWFCTKYFTHETFACAVCRCKAIFPLVGPTKLKNNVSKMLIVKNK